MENVKVDIIIPCYNSHETLDRCLGSILSQRILPSLKVTLVNDDGKPYDDIIKRYSPVMDIREIGYKGNGGPAKSRNYGLKNTSEELVMFMDSDDALANVFSVITMVNEMYSDPNNVMVISKFIEEVAPLSILVHEKDTSFMHGKLYRRSFLEKHNILFNEETRCNEDVGFNILALLIANGETEKVVFNNITSYYWLYNPSSLVRSDKENYDRSTSFRGFAENLTYVFVELNKRGMGENPNIILEKATTMQRLFLLYMQRTEGHPQFKKGNLEAVKKYYHKIYKKIEHLVSDDLFDKVYHNLPFEGDEKANKKAIKNFIKTL